MKIKATDYECRTIPGRVEVRQNEDGSSTIVGVAAIFNVLSENLGGFREMIAPGAFDETDMDDVRGLFNHNEDFVLGRTVSETLSLERSENGLNYSIDAPGTRTIQDLVVEPIKRGDVSQSSFGFIVGRGNDDWEENDDGVLIRTIRKFRKLFDVSPVTFPAYADTAVGVRSMEQYLEREKTAAEIRAQRHANGKVLDRLDRRNQLVSRC